MLLWSQHGRLTWGNLRELIKPSAQSSYLAQRLERIASDFPARENFFRKNTHAGSLVNTTLPACYIYRFMVSDSQ